VAASLAPGPGLVGYRQTTGLTGLAGDSRVLKDPLGGSPLRKLPDRVWRLPRQEDDESAAEGIGRILALSDGVFAIALTLLILDIAVPATTSDNELGAALLHLWPRYLAYALSFLVIARFWVIHHQTFRLIVRDNATLVWLNFLLLIFIAFLPFPTAVLGAHERSPAAAVLYAVALCLTSASSAAYLWYATGRGNLLRPDVGRAQRRAMRARSMSGPVFFALTVPVAAFAPYVAEALWVFAFPLARISFVWFSAEQSGRARLP
jgi:TMEM175 potassium channel family protein